MRTLRSGVNYDRNIVSRETAMPDNQVLFPSRTIQSSKDECDINVIVRRFGVTGQLPGNFRPPSYGDYSGVGDFKTAMNAVREGEESFMRLPSGVRKRFGNSPQAFLEFATNPDNLEDLRKMGLAIPKPVVKIDTSAEIVPPKLEKDDARGLSRRTGKAAEKGSRSERDADGD